MKQLRPEEEWARQMVEAALQVPVVQHDDNLQSAMHDLQVLHTDGRLAAIEVTAAADAASIELWKLVNGSSDRWQVEGLVGGWSVALYPDARAKRIVRDLPSTELTIQGAST